MTVPRTPAVDSSAQQVPVGGVARSGATTQLSVEGAAPLTDQQVRAAALLEAANELHVEARWQMERYTHALALGRIEAAARADECMTRFAVVETILRERAASLTSVVDGAPVANLAASGSTTEPNPNGGDEACAQ